MKIEIYGQTVCSYCNAAKAICKANGFEYAYINLDGPEDKEALERRVGQPIRSVPQIFVNNEYIGGYEAFKKFLTF